MSDDCNKIFQFKIVLKDSKPVIWRRIQVPGKYSFSEMHFVIQIAMGWSMTHCHRFEVWENLNIIKIIGEKIKKSKILHISEHETKLFEYFISPKFNVVYIYDLGDKWEHEMVLEETLDITEGVKYPLCIDGERACPPESCGGVSSYTNLLAILADNKRKEYSTMCKWLEKAGKKQFNPEKFDPTNVKFYDFCSTPTDSDESL